MKALAVWYSGLVNRLQSSLSLESYFTIYSLALGKFLTHLCKPQLSHLQNPDY